MILCARVHLCVLMCVCSSTSYSSNDQNTIGIMFYLQTEDILACEDLVLKNSKECLGVEILF